MEVDGSSVVDDAFIYTIKKKFALIMSLIGLVLVSLFNRISTFVCHLMPKPYFYDSSDSI